jgi:hypothetical protein
VGLAFKEYMTNINQKCVEEEKSNFELDKHVEKIRKEKKIGRTTRDNHMLNQCHCMKLIET